MFNAMSMTRALITRRPAYRTVVINLLLMASAAASADDRIHLWIKNQGSQPLEVSSSSIYVVPAPAGIVPGWFENNDCTAPNLPTTVAPGSSVEVCSTLIDSGVGDTVGIWTVGGVYQGQGTSLVLATITDPPVGQLTCSGLCGDFSDQGDGEYNLTITWTDEAGASQNWPPKIPMAVYGPEMVIDKVQCKANGKTIRAKPVGSKGFSCDALKTRPGKPVRIVATGKAAQ